MKISSQHTEVRKETKQEEKQTAKNRFSLRTINLEKQKKKPNIRN